MKERDIELLFLQIKNIIYNKPISQDLKTDTKELEKIQQGIEYLSACIEETNNFLKHLSTGNLEIETPGRHNFLSGPLKGLHADLKHLVWQSHQVANGDYKQRVRFLGEFSESFNKMISQLEERENTLKEQSILLTQTVELMVSIMDGLKEWIIVTEKGTNEIIYVNNSAKMLLSDIRDSVHNCGNQCALIKKLTSYINIPEDEMQFEYQCEFNKKIFYVKSFFIKWNEKIAYAHFITDITTESSKKELLENLAFKDELTGLFNRRYCLTKLSEFIDKKIEFSLCLIDMDGLKLVNDNLGHLKGDEYIGTIAEQMIIQSRTSDISCRIGGDEFLMIFPDCKEDVVINKLIKINQDLLKIETNYDMSVSYGVIQVKEQNKLEAEELIKIVDDKMYKFKKSRRKERV